MILRRVIRGVMWGLLMVLIFHRPILHVGGRWAAQWLAGKEHLVLDLRVSGNVWSTLELRDVKVRDDGSGLGAVESLTLDRLYVDYDLWKLFRGDWRQALKRVDIATINGVLTPQDSGPDKPSKPIAVQFNELLKGLDLPTGQINIGSVSLAVKDQFSVDALSLKASRGTGGEFGWKNLSIAGGLTTGEIRVPFQHDAQGLLIQEFRVAERLEIVRLLLTHRSEALPDGGLEIKVAVADGQFTLRVAPDANPQALVITLVSSAIQLKEVIEMAGGISPVSAVLDDLKLSLIGVPEKVESWTGSLSLQAHSEATEHSLTGNAELRADWNKGVMGLKTLKIHADGLNFEAEGAMEISPTEPDIHKANGKISYKLNASDLSKFPGELGLQGSLQSEGILSIGGGRITADAVVQGGDLNYGTNTIKTLNAKLNAQRGVETLGDALHSLTAQYTVEATDAQIGDVLMDRLLSEGDFGDRKLVVKTINFTRGRNVVEASGGLFLKDDGYGLAETGTAFRLAINAPELEQMGLKVNGALLRGSLTGNADITLENLKPEGTLHLQGENLKFADASLGDLTADFRAVDGTLQCSQFQLGVADAGTISASGSVKMAEEFRLSTYEAKLTGDFHDLRKLDPLLAALGMKMKLFGKANLTWSGEGDFAEKHQGTFKLDAKDAYVDTLRLDVAQVSGDYAPGRLDIADFLIAADKASLGGGVRLESGVIKTDKLVIKLDGKPVLEGSLELPFKPKWDGQMLAEDEPLLASVTATNLDLPKLFQSFGRKPPVTGVLDLNLKASGTLASPVGELHLGISSLSGEGLLQLDPAALKLKLTLSSARLAADLSITQKNIQPLKATASLPFVLLDLLKKPETLTALPLQGAVVLPSTKLDFLTSFVPSIARLDGSAAADIKIAGTIGKPDIKGYLDVEVHVLRMVSETAPKVSGLKTRINLEEDRVNIANFSGSIGGGTFSLSGGAKFEPGATLQLDLRLQSKKVLILRNEDLTVRADTDIQLIGPLNTATLKGEVFVTQSRFLKDIDILPLSLPGQPKPQVRSISKPLNISFPNPPLRDWKLDVAIRTRDDDPFLIRGNVARGEIVLDLRLNGTGLEPYLDGYAEIRDFRGNLPVGSLTVNSGWVTFSKADPFNPMLDIQGDSLIQNYMITAYVSGSAEAPRLDLFSEPPLPQQDILALLTTGTTTGEIGKSSEALAARAAVLVLKKWYRKVFKRNPPSDGKDSNEWFVNNFQIDVGSVDARTGRPEVSTSVKLSKRFYLIGDVDLDGQFSGLLRYVIRFR